MRIPVMVRFWLSFLFLFNRDAFRREVDIGSFVAMPVGHIE